MASSILALYTGAFSMHVSPSWDLRILEFLLPAHFQDQVPKCSRERNCGVSIELLHIGTWCFYLTRRRNFLTRGTDAWFSLLSPSKCASTEKKSNHLSLPLHRNYLTQIRELCSKILEHLGTSLITKRSQEGKTSLSIALKKAFESRTCLRRTCTN